MRLIDANELIKTIEKDTWIGAQGKDYAISDVSTAPAIDAAPVVHGRWEVIEARGKTALYRCTACKTEMIDFAGREDYHCYCHKCGAKMDKEE